MFSALIAFPLCNQNKVERINNLVLIMKRIYHDVKQA